jgi:hypothetical protein
MRSFARDVGINVVANLIAAGILYLIGAGIGLFPRNPAALLATTTISIPVMSVFLLILYLIPASPSNRTLPRLIQFLRTCPWP